jgi:hypothetical protein
MSSLKKRSLRDHFINLLGAFLLVGILYGSVVLPIENHNLLRQHSSDLVIQQKQQAALTQEVNELNSYASYITNTLTAICQAEHIPNCPPPSPSPALPPSP